MVMKKERKIKKIMEKDTRNNESIIRRVGWTVKVHGVCDTKIIILCIDSDSKW